MSKASLLVTFGAALVFLTPASRVAATLVISALNTTSTVDFDNTVTDMNNGAWAGTGFQSSPVAGQLDSDSWAVTGWSDGSLSFGGSRLTGDYARGAITTPQTTGGFYSRTNLATGRALWIQPGGSDFAPGTLTLRVQNQTGVTSTNWDISYLIYNLNDQARSNSFNFSYSTDDTTYTPIGALDFTSPLAADATPSVVSFTRSTSIALAVANNGFLYLRWSGADVGGSGSRDEFGIDNIAISMSAVPEPAAVLFGGLVCGVLGLTVAGRRALAWLYGKNLNAAAA